jgi:hypothetical protein
MVTPLLDPPIRVFLSDEYWRVAYGSYIDGFHATRTEAIATAAAAHEHEAGGQESRVSGIGQTSPTQ